MEATWHNEQVKTTSLGGVRDRSFGAYLRATAGSSRSGLIRFLSAVFFGAALIADRGIVGMEIIAAAVIGGISLGYPLWRRRGPVQ